MLTILIPMAGKGSRFSNAGYSTPKPLIEVAGKTLIERSIETLGFQDAHFVFITRSFQNLEDNEALTGIFTRLCKSFTEVRVDSEHLGAAHSAMYAEKYIDSDSELIISNCDQSLIWDSSDFLKSMRNDNADGGLVLFNSSKEQHSFARIDGWSVREVAEKRVISQNALVGVHYWKSAELFFDSARSLMSDYEQNGYKEAYVSLTYNYLIEDKKKVVPYFFSEKDRYYPLGTPEDVDLYLNMGDKVRLHFDSINLKAEYESIEKYNNGLEYSVLNNVCIENLNPSSEILNLQNVFLFNGNEKSFYHLMADVVGQYLVLNEISGAPIVPLYIETSPELSWETSSDVMKEVVSSGMINLQIAGSNVKTINIEKLYIISPRDYSLFYKLFMNAIPDILTEESHPGNQKYIKRVLGATRKQLLKYLKINDDIKQVNKVFLHGSNNKVGTGSEEIDETHERFVSKKAYLSLVNEYRQSGYSVVDPEGLSLQEQVNLVRGASSIATIKGSNSLHSIYANPDTEFIMINLKSENTFPHETIVKSFINNPIFIDRSDSENI